MPDGLYERDALAWAEQQAGLLRRLAAGEAVEGLVDWANVIEEVGDVGLAELRACQSPLRKAMVGLLRLRAWPDSSAAPHWHNEIGTFLADAENRFTPSMRQRIDLAELYSKALYLARKTAGEGGVARPLPDACPYALEELLAVQPDVAELVARLGGVGGGQAALGDGRGG